MTDLRQAAQPAEPCIGKDPRCPCQDGDACHYKDCGSTKARPVPQAEPVACRFCHDQRGCWTWQCYNCGEIDDVQKPTPSAAQRPWIGLTPEEILDLFDRNNVYGSKWIEFARSVEAKLKAKNV